MDQKGRLVVREYGARLEEAVHRIRYERDSLVKLLQESYDQLDVLRDDEQYKLDNIEGAGTGLEHTSRAENIRDGIDTLQDSLDEIEQIQLYLEIEEGQNDPLNIDFKTLLKVSKV